MSRLHEVIGSATDAQVTQAYLNDPWFLAQRYRAQLHTTIDRLFQHDSSRLDQNGPHRYQFFLIRNLNSNVLSQDITTNCKNKKKLCFR